MSIGFMVYFVVVAAIKLIDITIDNISTTKKNNLFPLIFTAATVLI